MLNKRDEKIFVDLDDEITFVVERIRETEADRVILVAPEGANVISSLVSLKLLSKLVYKLGKSLIIVTLDDTAHKFAEKSGVQMVHRVADVGEGLWIEAEEKLKKRGMNPVLGQNQNSGIKYPTQMRGKQDNKEEKDKKEFESTEDSLLEDLADSAVSDEEKPTMEEVGLEREQKDFFEESKTKNEKRKIENDVPNFLKNSFKAEESSVTDTASDLESFGFVVGEDILKKEVITKRPEKILEHREFVSDFRGEEKEEKDELRVVGKDMTGYELEEPASSKIKSALNPKNLFAGFKNFKFPKLKFKFFVPIIVLFLILASIGGLYAYFIAPTAAIEVNVKYETVNLEKDIKAVTSVTDVDLANLSIPLVMQEVEESGSDSTSATGKETRGEKAKGKVTIVNKTEDVVQLGTRTVLAGSGHNFLLLNNEEIPAADIFAGTLGRKEVNVEAYDIGTEYNLVAGTEFTVQGYATSALVGKSFEAFSGGSKEEVTVVTANDRETLKTSLENNLKERAKRKIKDQVGAGFVLNDAMIDLEVTETIFDAEAGTEASSVNLNMKVKARGYVYSSEDLKTLGKQLLQAEVPSGLKLLEDQSEYNADFVNRDGDKANLKLKVVGVISGDVTTDSIKELLAGKNYDAANKSLSELESITSYNINLGPHWLPTKLRHVPNIKGKIVVNLVVDKGE